jgi:glucose-6-phosphate 1-dehydrogenase
VSAIIHATSVQSATGASLPQAVSALLVIFGASGDLTRRKLIPALYDLTCVGCVPRKFEVLGVGRTRMTTEEFRALILKTNLDPAGHGGSSGRYDRLKEAAFDYAFVLMQMRINN